MIAGSSSFFKYIGNKLLYERLWATLLKLKLTSEAKNSSSYYRQGRQLLLTFLAMVTHWSRSTSNFYALIGQNLTMQKIHAASGDLFTDSWSSQSFVASSCDVFNCLFPLDIQNEIQLLYQDCSVIHSWFVYRVLGWEMRHLSKPSEIVKSENRLAGKVSLEIFERFR